MRHGHGSEGVVEGEPAQLHQGDTQFSKLYKVGKYLGCTPISQVAKLGLHFLSAPASSVSSERLFSRAGMIYSNPKRNRLGADHAQRNLIVSCYKVPEGKKVLKPLIVDPRQLSFDPVVSTVIDENDGLPLDREKTVDVDVRDENDSDDYSDEE